MRKLAKLLSKQPASVFSRRYLMGILSFLMLGYSIESVAVAVTPNHWEIGLAAGAAFMSVTPKTTTIDVNGTQSFTHTLNSTQSVVPMIRLTGGYNFAMNNPMIKDIYVGTGVSAWDKTINSSLAPANLAASSSSLTLTSVTWLFEGQLRGPKLFFIQPFVTAGLGPTWNYTAFTPPSDSSFANDLLNEKTMAQFYYQGGAGLIFDLIRNIKCSVIYLYTSFGSFSLRNGEHVTSSAHSVGSNNALFQLTYQIE